MQSAVHDRPHREQSGLYTAERRVIYRRAQSDPSRSVECPSAERGERRLIGPRAQDDRARLVASGRRTPRCLLAPPDTSFPLTKALTIGVEVRLLRGAKRRLAELELRAAMEASSSRGSPNGSEQLQACVVAAVREGVELGLVRAAQRRLAGLDDNVIPLGGWV